MDESFQNRLDYINELDKLKFVERANYIGEGVRRENSAEHSWHLAKLVMIYAPHEEGVDVLKAMQMALIHDVVEIDTGDVPIYEAMKMTDLFVEEKLAAERIFGLLPDGQNAYYLDLWIEFETKSSKTARFVKLMDRVSPFLQQMRSSGKAWLEHQVCVDDARALYEPFRSEFPQMVEFVNRTFDQAIESGFILTRN